MTEFLSVVYGRQERIYRLHPKHEFDKMGDKGLRDECKLKYTFFDIAVRLYISYLVSTIYKKN